MNELEAVKITSTHVRTAVHFANDLCLSAIRNLSKILLRFDLYFGFILHDLRYIRYFDKFAGTAVIDLRLKSVLPNVEGVTEKSR
jgi:hypothetical protein